MRYPTKLIKESMVCAEVGVWRGNNAKSILKQNPKKLCLIDPWVYQPSFPKRRYGGKRASSQEEMDNIYKEVVNKFRDEPKIEIYRKFSYKCRNIFSDKYFDWVYIDGNHEFEHVLTDLIIFYQKLKNRGFLTGDDYTRCGKPVTDAVEYFCEIYNLNQEIRGKQFVIRK